MDPFLYLPEEISLTISRYFKEKELKKYSSVSKLWHRILSDDSLWKVYGNVRRLVVKLERKRALAFFGKEMALSLGHKALSIKKIPGSFAKEVLLKITPRFTPYVPHKISYSELSLIHSGKTALTKVLFFRILYKKRGDLVLGILISTGSEWAPLTRYDPIFKDPKNVLKTVSKIIHGQTPGVLY